MKTLPIDHVRVANDANWVPFPGGELEGVRAEGVRARELCASCRAKRRDIAGLRPARPALCFQCYRLEFERNQRLKAAGELDTASEARFQSQLPFESVSRSRLARLKTERSADRVKAREGVGLHIEQRRRAQIEARQALAEILHGLKQRGTPSSLRSSDDASIVAATRAAEMQLPESWLPFVVSR
jgi:hypothetical protein